MSDPQWSIDPESGILSIHDEALRTVVQKMFNDLNDEHEAALAHERFQTQTMRNYGEHEVALRRAEEASNQRLRDIIAQAKERIGTAAFGGGPYGPTVSLVRSVYDILDDPRLKFDPPTPEEPA